MGVELPYSLILLQFWLYFVFKFVVVLFLVVRGGTVCLPMPPPWLEVCLVVFGATSIQWASSASYKSSSFEGGALALRVSPPLPSDWSNPPVTKGFC